VRWRINGWQPTGSRVVLAAQFKSGKTVLVGNLIRSLVDGNSWLGAHDVTVALLDDEMSENQLDEWLREQAIRH
jgi:RecA-family ATPase